jgi:predicted secreted protein
MRIVDWAARSLATTILAVVGLAALAILAGIRLDLTPVGSFGLYFIIWWTMLFAILPVRMQSQADAGSVTAGTEPGAPAAPALRERAIWTTIVSAIVFVGVAAFFPLAGL